MSNAINDVIAERARQMSKYSAEHDDSHAGENEMAIAAVVYAEFAGARLPEPPPHWPWDAYCWKPRSQREDLVRAAALLIAEIERLDRATEKGA